MSSFEVVIPSYGREHLLPDQLLWLRRLYPHLPVCWGLQGAYDPHLDGLAKNTEQLRIVHDPSPHITRTINTCLQSSQADYVLLLDDDAHPCPGWLEAFTAVFEDSPDLIYCMGREIRVHQHWSLLGAWARLGAESVFYFFVPPSARAQGRIVGWMNALGFLWGNFDLAGTGRINSPRGCNLALHCKKTLEHGGFDERFQGSEWGFETEFGLRLQHQGHWGAYCGQAAVLHAQAPQGGTRAHDAWSGLKASWHNHKLVNKHLGPLAWIGALPRLVRAGYRGLSSLR